MVARVYLVRHSESALQGAYCGRRSDPDLSPAGLAQSVLLSETFREVELTGLWSSSQTRARRTAEEIGRRRGLTPIPDPRFDEMDFGEWDGFTHAEISARWPEAYADWLSSPTTARPPKGETVPEVSARCRAALESVIGTAEREPDQACAKQAAFRTNESGPAVAIVSHGGTIRLLLAWLLRMPVAEYWRFRVDTGSVTAVDIFDGGAAILVYSNRGAASGLPYFDDMVVPES